MKKLTSLLILTLALSACGGPKDIDTPNQTTTETENIVNLDTESRSYNSKYDFAFNYPNTFVRDSRYNFVTSKGDESQNLLEEWTVNFGEQTVFGIKVYDTSETELIESNALTRTEEIVALNGVNGIKVTGENFSDAILYTQEKKTYLIYSNLSEESSELKAQYESILAGFTWL